MVSCPPALRRTHIIATDALGIHCSHVIHRLFIWQGSYPQPVDKPLFAPQNEALPMEHLWITCAQLAICSDLSFLIPGHRVPPLIDPGPFWWLLEACPSIQERPLILTRDCMLSYSTLRAHHARATCDLEHPFRPSLCSASACTRSNTGDRLGAPRRGRRATVPGRNRREAA